MEGETERGREGQRRREGERDREQREWEGKSELKLCALAPPTPPICHPPPAAELKRVRADGQLAQAQSEREKDDLAQALALGQQEAQQVLRSAQIDHQEEVERLISEKVRGCG